MSAKAKESLRTPFLMANQYCCNKINATLVMANNLYFFTTMTKYQFLLKKKKAEN